MAALCGLGGAGKTSVAVEYAYRHLATLGVVWQFPAVEPAALAAGFGGEIPPQHAPVSPYLLCEAPELREQRFGRQVGGAQRVIDAFAGDGIHQTRSGAHRQPTIARHAILLPRRSLERWQDR